MATIPLLLALPLSTAGLAACAPPGQGRYHAAASPPAKGAGEPSRPDLNVTEAPDVDPVTGINRGVTYEPELGREPGTPSPKDSRRPKPKN